MVSIIIKEWTTKIELVPTVQKRNAAVLLRKPGRLAPQYAACWDISGPNVPTLAHLWQCFVGMMTFFQPQRAYRKAN